MQRSAIVFSTLMHIAFFVLAYVGLPNWWESVVVETPIPVQVVENISDVTSPAPAPETVETPPPPEVPEEPAVEQPPPPAPTPPPAPQPVEEVPVQEPEEVVPEPIPDESVEEDEPEEVEPEPEEVQLAEQPPAKPEPPEEVVEERQEEPEEDTAFTDLLRDLENVAETQTAQAEPTQTQSETPPIPTSSSSDNLSISAKDAMRRKVISCWNIDPGTRDAEDMLIVIRLWLNPDGSVQNVKIEDDGSWGGNAVYRAASESAQRAVLRCAPYYDVLGKEPYEDWSFMTLRFSPKDLLR